MAGWIEPGVVFSGVEISAPGSGPILFGNLRSTYTIVDRQATTVLHGPYSAGFYHLFKCEARLGGAVTCPNASRFLFIK